MNPIHIAIVAHFRAHIVAPTFVELLEKWNDIELVRRMFSNFRDGMGLRLTLFGQQILSHCFECYEFANITENTARPAQLLFLDAHCKMPYYYDSKKFIVYDMLFAVRLRLVSGSLPILMEIDTYE